MSGQVVTRSIEVVQVSATQDLDDDICHIVCHCTNDQTAARGLDCSDVPWSDESDEPCPLCMLAWPDGVATCPWGCSCIDDCGPGDDE